MRAISAVYWWGGTGTINKRLWNEKKERNKFCESQCIQTLYINKYHKSTHKLEKQKKKIKIASKICTNQWTLNPTSIMFYYSIYYVCVRVCIFQTEIPANSMNFIYSSANFIKLYSFSKSIARILHFAEIGLWWTQKRQTMMLKVVWNFTTNHKIYWNWRKKETW